MSANMTRTCVSYNGEAFCSNYPDECIAVFKPGAYPFGSTDKESVLQIIETLNQRIKVDTSIISFNPEMIADQLTGGACSALALTVAREAIYRIRDLEERNDLTPSVKGRSLTHQLGRFIAAIIENGKSQAKESVLKQKEIRNIQQAFNTISIDEKTRIASKTDDLLKASFVREKMKSLASYFDLTIDGGTEEIDLAKTTDVEKCILKSREELLDGVYLLRLLEKTYNHKMEVRGHTITYIKAFSQELYFDPMLGFFELFRNAAKVDLIYKAIDSAFTQNLTIDTLSFHKLCPRIKCEKPTPNVDVKGASTSESRFLTPVPRGPFKTIGVRSYSLEDPSRNEKDLGHHVDCPRRLEIEVHYPALADDKAPFKVFATVDQGGKIVDTAAKARSQCNLKPIEGKKFPVLIFSPGLGASLDDFQHIVEECASAGFCVIAINHPYSGLFVRYLGENQYPMPRLEEEAIIKEGLVKGSDIAFLAKQLISNGLNSIIGDLSASLDTGAIGVMGHSLGGSSAVEACRLEPALLGAVDLDGRVIHTEKQRPVAKPVLLISAKREKKGREAFERAYSCLAEGRDDISRLEVDANHGDFSLVTAYRGKNGVKGMTERQSKIAEITTDKIITFFQNLLPVSK